MAYTNALLRLGPVTHKPESKLQQSIFCVSFAVFE